MYKPLSGYLDIFSVAEYDCYLDRLVSKKLIKNSIWLWFCRIGKDRTSYWRYSEWKI